MTDGDGGEARVKESEPDAESYPIIVRSYEPVADLDDRLQRIYTRLSLPPLEEVEEPRTLRRALGAGGDERLDRGARGRRGLGQRGA